MFTYNNDNNILFTYFIHCCCLFVCRYEPYYGALQKASVEKINNEIVCKTDSPKTTTTTSTTSNDKVCYSKKVYDSYSHLLAHRGRWGNFAPYAPLFIRRNIICNSTQKICLSNPAHFLGLQDVILLDSHSESDAESSASEQQLEETVVETEIMVCYFTVTLR